MPVTILNIIGPENVTAARACDARGRYDHDYSIRPGPHVLRFYSCCCLTFVFVLGTAAATAMPFRSPDGSGNNALDGSLGRAGATLLRITPNAYADGVAAPRSGDIAPLPGARAVSNAVAAQPASVVNRRGASDWLWQWGQFLDHDLSLTETAHGNDAFDILVPTGDPHFDPGMSGGARIPLQRSLHDIDGAGVRQQTNELTAYIDASQVYGSDAARAAALRGPGATLRMTPGGNGEVLLGQNSGGYANAEMGPTPSSGYFLAGDVRANEQIGLSAAHTLFAREHNRLVEELTARLGAGDTALIAERDAAIVDASNGITNQDDFTFEAARKIVGAQMQKITYTEFLPALIGVDLTRAYTGYDETVDAGISSEFSTAAFRVGHTMLSSELLRVDASGPTPGTTRVALRDAFFNPGEVFANGVDSLLLGLASQRAQAIDPLLVDDVRNFLFGPPGSGGFDLASLNLQRGRDHGIGSLNAVRDALGLSPYASFLDMTGGDALLAGAFASVYAAVDDVDLWIGGLAERGAGRSMLGETFTQIVLDQFTRSMLGDRFFYLAEMDALQILDEDFMSTTSLSAVIVRNSAVQSMQANAFFVAPEPGSLLLGGIAFVLLRRSCRRRCPPRLSA